MAREGNRRAVEDYIKTVILSRRSFFGEAGERRTVEGSPRARLIRTRRRLFRVKWLEILLPQLRAGRLARDRGRCPHLRTWRDPRVSKRRPPTVDDLPESLRRAPSRM